MTVKTRITLLVAGAGFAASLLFCVVVFFELVEQPLQILDSVLQEEAYRTAIMIVDKQKTAVPAQTDPGVRVMYPHWIEIVEQGAGGMIYRSALTRSVRLPRVPAGASAIANVTVPAGVMNTRYVGGRKVPFRIKTFSFALDGRSFIVQAARPMVKLDEEIRDLVLGIVSGLIFSTLALVAISRLVAGRILKPIGAMKDLARDISEKNLDRRIPTGPGGDEFSELAGTLNRMLDRLQYSFARQKDLLFDTSHELKTPLTTMRLAIDEVCALLDDRLPASARENFLRLNVQVMRMERLVKDLLNLSSLEILTRIDPKPVSLSGLLGGLSEDYRFLADARQIRLDVRISKELTVQGDAQKLSRAFSNILDNAVKYNTDGGRIEIVAGRSAAQVTVITTNTGPGLAESEIHRVFEQFYRVEKSRSLQHGGSGLGLAIVKRIIDLHGGRVTIESEPGAWTRVAVRLPVRPQGH